MDLDTDKAVSQDEFTCFRNLPAELREIIILMAVRPDSRYFGEHIHAGGLDNNNMHLSWVNAEFRAIYLSIYTKMVDEKDHKNPILKGLNLYAMLPYQSLRLCPTYKNVGGEWLRLLRPEACAKLQHVILELHYREWRTIALTARTLRKHLKEFVRFEDLKTLRVGAIGDPESDLLFFDNMKGREELAWRPDVKATVVATLDGLYDLDRKPESPS